MGRTVQKNCMLLNRNVFPTGQPYTAREIVFSVPDSQSTLLEDREIVPDVPTNPQVGTAETLEAIYGRTSSRTINSRESRHRP